MQEDTNKHFIKNIEIKNFKCFKDFKAEGFGRVNLIGGKNNVGKTAFMEALYVNVGSKSLKQFTASLYGIKYLREKLNILSDFHARKNFGNIVKEFLEKSNGICTKTNINNSLFKIEEKNGIKKYIFEYGSENLKVNINDFSYGLEPSKHVEYIDNFGLSNNQIISNYASVQKRDEEAYLNNFLKLLDKRIEAFKVIDEKPQCKVNNKYLEITELGDGARHLVSVVASLYAVENGYLFIDELDNGIHYTMLDKLWGIILDISSKLNVQVFATTHSKECIESYARVAKKLKETDIKFLSLYRNKENELKSITFDYEKIQDRIELGLDNR